MSQMPDLSKVQLVAEVGRGVFDQLFKPYGLTIQWHAVGQAIPGTFWGEPEAGLIQHTLHAREDTPVQSVLHEGCHWVCMSSERRAKLHTNVGGTALEECAVCYLQIQFAQRIPAIGKARILSDMDDWGYNFRTGSASSWYQTDAEDARDWLVRRGLLEATSHQLIDPS